MQEKIDFVPLLKYLILPFVSLISIIVLYFLVIGPYLQVVSERETLTRQKELSITKLTAKLDTLKEVKETENILKEYDNKLKTLVPNEDTPTLMVAKLDSLSSLNNFTRIDENKNIVNPENDRQGKIEVSFNGRTVGPLAAKNFLEAVNNDKEKIINLQNIELFDDFDNKYYRVSFKAVTIFNKTKVTVLPDEPVVNILTDQKFQEFIKKF